MPVRLRSRQDLSAAIALPDTLPSSVEESIDLARELGSTAPVPGSGRTLALWEMLATLAAHDLGAARVIEPHLDAHAILDQAGAATADDVRSLGVFAAEGGAPVHARPSADGWVLSGVKPWCSLADRLDAALVTALLPDGDRGLFDVSLRSPSVTALPDAWHARGLAEIPSGPVEFSDAPARMVGAPGWYLERPGFWWGGIGVAACWYGGAVAVARRLHRGARERPSELLDAALGRVDHTLHAARVSLADAAESVDTGREDARRLAHRVRAVIADAVETVLTASGRALGPAPLAMEEEHAKRVADLGLYVRQHHAERDLASLGRRLAAEEPAPW